jgi:thioredoxin 1
MSKVIEITDQNFEEEVLNADLPTEVDFWAPWCGPCMMVSPIYDKLSEEYVGRFKFCKINVDENQRTAAKYQIMSIPMQMYFAEGEKVDEILGAVPEDMIRSKVEEILKKFSPDEQGRLQRILSSWTELNKQHSEKFKRWTEKAKNPKDDPFYNSISQAVHGMEEANETLSQLLVELQGDKQKDRD